MKVEMYQYSECGLDYVYLVNGFNRVPIEDGQTVTVIEDVDGLHFAIRNYVVGMPRRLTGAEIRFLRKEMDVSQRQLALVVGVEEQTVSLWERGAHEIPQAAELVLRTWVKEHDSNQPEIRELTERMNALDRELFELEKLELKRSGTEWVKKAA